ncbi:MAG: PIN domain-containing protein [Anaerolineae bacterium]|nr:PIN domain-containing protein [Anaerolineae bacterium]
MSVAAVDTQILAWAIMSEIDTTPQQARLAARLFQTLEHNDHGIVIPSMVVGELLATIPAERHTEILGRLQPAWQIADYNLQAAALFAKLRRDWRTQNRLKDIRAFHPKIARKELVADVMIIASALSHGADRIYSADATFCRMADGFITAEDLSSELGS